MTRKQTIASQIIVMQEWLQGKAVQWAKNGSDQWEDVPESDAPLWDWYGENYRLKPPQKWLPIGPVNIQVCNQIREEHFKDGIAMGVLSVFTDGVIVAVPDEKKTPVLKNYSWDELFQKCEMRRSVIDTWRPCKRF